MQHRYQVIGRAGFLEKIERPLPHGLDSHGNVALARKQHDRQFRVDTVGVFQKVEPVTAGHSDIGKDHAWKIRSDMILRLDK